MYGKRKLIRVFEVSNKRKLKTEEFWASALNKKFQTASLDMCEIVQTNVDISDDWKIAAVKTKDDKRGDVGKICILFQCYICVREKISRERNWCAYIPVEVDLESGLLLVKAWRRQGVEDNEAYKYNTLMNKVVMWLKDTGVRVKVIQDTYKRTLANMNESLIAELLEKISACKEIERLSDTFARAEKEILENISFENAVDEDGERVFHKRIMDIRKEMKNLVIRAAVSDYFFKRDFDEVWKMGISAVINSVKFSELDNSITIVKSENNARPVFCAKPFLMLLTAMDKTSQENHKTAIGE